MAESHKPRFNYLKLKKRKIQKLLRSLSFYNNFPWEEFSYIYLGVTFVQILIRVFNSFYVILLDSSTILNIKVTNCFFLQLVRFRDKM